MRLPLLFEHLPASREVLIEKLGEVSARSEIFRNYEGERMGRRLGKENYNQYQQVSRSQEQLGPMDLCRWEK